MHVRNALARTMRAVGIRFALRIETGTPVLELVCRRFKSLRERNPTNGSSVGAGVGPRPAARKSLNPGQARTAALSALSYT